MRHKWCCMKHSKHHYNIYGLRARLFVIMKLPVHAHIWISKLLPTPRPICANFPVYACSISSYLSLKCKLLTLGSQRLLIHLYLIIKQTCYKLFKKNEKKWQEKKKVYKC